MGLCLEVDAVPPAFGLNWCWNVFVVFLADLGGFVWVMVLLNEGCCVVGFTTRIKGETDRCFDFM